MLSRASGALRPRASHALPIARPAWIALQTRTHANWYRQGRQNGQYDDAAFQEAILKRSRSYNEARAPEEAPRRQSRQPRQRENSRKRSGNESAFKEPSRVQRENARKDRVIKSPFKEPDKVQRENARNESGSESPFNGTGTVQRDHASQKQDGSRIRRVATTRPSSRAIQGILPREDGTLTTRARRQLLELRDFEADTRCGIIATSQPQETTIEKLLQGIESKPLTKVLGRTDGGGNQATLILLFTPGLARHALDRNVPAAVAEALQLRSFPGKLRSVTAVVDRLPTSAGQQEGSEGMAYMLLQNPSRFGPDSHTPMQESAQKPGSLKFVIAKQMHAETSAIAYTLQLPLSQTVFSTGLVSTMFERHYNYQDKEAQSGWLFDGEKQLENQTLHLPVLNTPGVLDIFFSPLVPLTPFRKIQYAMGNIVRKLSPQSRWWDEQEGGHKALRETPDDPDQSMPASQELEQAVSKYFETLDLNPAPVNVWALVIPRDADFKRACCNMGGPVKKLLLLDEEGIVPSWKAQSKCSDNAFPGAWYIMQRRLIPEGARLIKVLSGGGGWGKKAGLLSLDPDSEYSTRELRQDEGWKFNFDNFDDGTPASTEAQKKQALGETVKEGDSVMFLLAPSLEKLEESLEDVEKHKDAKHEGAKPQVDLSFGVLPSSIDDIPQKMESVSAPATIQHYPGRFGMLSEGGMALNYKHPNLPGRKEGQTKYDAPFSRIGFRSYDGKYWPELHSRLRPRDSSVTSPPAQEADESNDDSALTFEYNPEAMEDYFEQVAMDDGPASPPRSGGRETSGSTAEGKSQ